jgi:hypothetical protein
MGSIALVVLSGNLRSAASKSLLVKPPSCLTLSQR